VLEKLILETKKNALVEKVKICESLLASESREHPLRSIREMTIMQHNITNKLMFSMNLGDRGDDPKKKPPATISCWSHFLKLAKQLSHLTARRKSAKKESLSVKSPAAHKRST
jgi:hypothetical protein